MDHVEIIEFLKLLKNIEISRKIQRISASNFKEKNRLHQFCTFSDLIFDKRILKIYLM